MSSSKLDIPELETMDDIELEKGERRPSIAERLRITREKRRRSDKVWPFYWCVSKLIFQILLSCCAILLLLWHCGAFQPTIYIQPPRHVHGVPQYILDYGKSLSLLRNQVNSFSTPRMARRTRILFPIRHLCTSRKYNTLQESNRTQIVSTTPHSYQSRPT